MSKERKKFQKQKAREAMVKQKLLKKRKLIREQAKLEREVAEIQRQMEPKIEPIKKKKDE